MKTSFVHVVKSETRKCCNLFGIDSTVTINNAIWIENVYEYKVKERSKARSVFMSASNSDCMTQSNEEFVNNKTFSFIVLFFYCFIQNSIPY